MATSSGFVPLLLHISVNIVLHFGESGGSLNPALVSDNFIVIDVPHLLRALSTFICQCGVC